MKRHIKFFILFIMVIHSAAGRIEKFEKDKLDTLDNESIKFANNEYGETVNGNQFYEDDLEDLEIENSGKGGTFSDRLKKLPAKTLFSLLNSGHEFKSGMGKVFSEGKVIEGAKQSFGGFFGLFKDGWTNAKDLAFG